LDEVTGGVKHADAAPVGSKAKATSTGTDALMREVDWSRSPLGPREDWPAWLGSTVALMRDSGFPMFLAAGPELGFLYNDAYADILGAKHPAAMGARFQDVWSEIWTDIAPYVDQALSGQRTWVENLSLTMNRHGYEEETWFTFSYSPLRDEDGAIAGMFCACTETTGRVLAERALRASEERTSGVLEGMAEGFVLLDREFRIVRINAEGLRLEGRSAGDIIGRTHWDAYPGSEAGELGRLYKQAMAERVPVSRMHRFRWPDGHRSWLDMRAYPTPDGGLAVFYRDVTASREAEERLRESEAQLRLATDAAEIGLWDVDVVRETLFWPARVKAMFGISPDVPVSMANYYAGLHPDDREAASAAFASAADPVARALYDVEYRTVGKEDGRIRWVSAKGRGLFDEAGRCLRVIGTAIDITERKRTEDILRESEMRFRNMADHAPVMMWVTDADGACTYLNRRWYEYTGQTEAEGLGFGWLDAVHPGDRAASGDAFLTANETKAAFRVEYRLRGTDGLYRWFIDAAQPRLGEDGGFLGYIGSVVDIHDRKAAEERLVETTRRLDAILANTSQAIFLMDERQRCAYMNAAAERLTGYGLDEVLARDCPLHDVVHHTRPDGTPFPLCECPIDRAFPENEREQGEEVFVHKDGSFYPVGFTASPIRNERGEPVGTVIEARNIEGELRAKAAMEAFNATLEKRLEEEATRREVAEEALRQSQKMEAVGQLTGGLAHDFNNLLTGISGSLELMQTRMSQGRLTDLDRYMSAAQGAAKRAAALTHRLLAFSRRQTLDPKPTDVNALVHGMEDLIRRTVGPSVDVEVVGSAGLWVALVDAGQLENALLNLCINARDAMPEGGRITIETANRWLDDRIARERDMPQGQYLSLCVTDTGAGMTPDIAARAFEPFFTTKPIGQGTGLGLSMIYGFVRQSGGQVRIYSEVGQGTTVCLYLPRHHGDAAGPEEMPDLAGARRAEQGETVLVIDDEPSIRMLVTEVLEELGYTAIEAADGPSGLKVLQSDVRIDLLVTDVGLPGGMNGRQVADAARVSRPGLKVLFITGYAENAAVGNGYLDAGMQVLTKPFVMETLASRIRDLIER
jgi:PAS domain S-box-containing protein